MATTAEPAVPTPQIVPPKSGFEVRFIELCMTRERVYSDGDVTQEKYSITANGELILEKGSYLEADEAIARFITRDDLDA